MSQIGYLEALSDKQLREKCKDYGLPDVPVTDTSRKLLIRRILIAMGEIPEKKTKSRASTSTKPRSSSPVKRNQSPGRANKSNVSNVRNVSHNKNANISSTTTTSPKPRATANSSHKMPISLNITISDDDNDDELNGNEDIIVQKAPESYGIRQKLAVAAKPRPAVALKKTNLIKTSNRKSVLAKPESLQHLEEDDESICSSIPRSNRSVSLSRSEVVTTSYKQELAPVRVHEVEDDEEDMEYSDYDEEEEVSEEEEESEQDDNQHYSNNNNNYNKSYDSNSYETSHSTSLLNSTFKTPEPVGRTIIHPIRRETEPKQKTSTFLANMQQQQSRREATPPKHETSSFLASLQAQQQRQLNFSPNISNLAGNGQADYASKAQTTNVPFHINTTTTSPLSASSNTSLHHRTLNSPLTETSSEASYTNRIYPSLPRQEYSSAPYEPAFLTKRKTFVENYPQEQQNVNLLNSQQPDMQSYSKNKAFNNKLNTNYTNSMRQSYGVHNDGIHAEDINNYSQEEDEEMDNASDGDTTQTTYNSQFVRKLEQHQKSANISSRVAISKPGYLDNVAAIDSKYHIKQTLALILCFLLAVFIYVFFLQ